MLLTPPSCVLGSEKSTSNYCVTMDRGYGHVEAQEAAAKAGVYTNALVVFNRKGLPRNYLADLRNDLSTCNPEAGPDAKCTHGPDAIDCRMYMYTMLHKQSYRRDAAGAEGAEWELTCWQDSELIVSLGNFFSGTRCGLLARGAYKQVTSFSVWVPESIWHYNVQGRSATDGADQLRKKLSIAERRTLRIGHKGINFVFDLALTNASIMWKFVHEAAGEKRWVLDNKFNKV